MNATKMVEILEDFVRANNDEKCITFDGVWGIGKTYSLEKWLKSFSERKTFGNECYKVIYISLFGIKNSDDLINKIINKISKFKDVLKKIKKSISGMSLGVGRYSISVPSLFEFNDLPKINKGNYLFIFDDLERKGTELDLRSLFSIIEQLNQNNNVKVVSIINSSKLDDLSEYFNYKEKVCDKTYKINEVDHQVVKKIINKGLSFDAYLEAEEVIKKYNLKNLRTFKKINRFISKILSNNELFNDNVVKKYICQWVCLIVSQVEDNVFGKFDFDAAKSKAEGIFEDIIEIRKTQFEDVEDLNLKNLCDNVCSEMRLDYGTFEWEIVENIYLEYLHCESQLNFIKSNTPEHWQVNNKLKEMFYYDTSEKIKYLKECIDEISNNWIFVNENNIFTCFDIILNYYDLLINYELIIDYNIDDFVNSLIECLSILYVKQATLIDRIEMRYLYGKKENDLTTKIRNIILTSKDKAFEQLMEKLLNAYQNKNITAMNETKENIFIFINSSKNIHDKYDEKFVNGVKINQGYILIPEGSLNDQIWYAYHKFYKDISHRYSLSDYYQNLFNEQLLLFDEPTTKYRIKCLIDNVI